MDQRPIGVFDSGLGGLTAVREMRRLMPSENIIYFGDTSRVPYGGRSPEILLKYARQDVHFLRSFDIKAVLVACGTVSTTALPQLQAENDLPILGVVEPACRKAAAMTRNRRVGLIATAASVRSGAYERTLHRLDETIHVVSRACPLLVPLVENGRYQPGDVVIETVAREYLEPLRQEGLDVLILGCTHYPLLTDIIREIMGPEVSLVNAGAESVHTLHDALARRQLLAPEGPDRRCCVPVTGRRASARWPAASCRRSLRLPCGWWTSRDTEEAVMEGNVKVHVESRTRLPDMEDVLHFRGSGTLERTPSGWQLRYQARSDEDGSLMTSELWLEDCGCVTLRSGNSYRMRLDPAAPTALHLPTQEGVLALDVAAHELLWELEQEEQGHITLDYSLHMGQTPVSALTVRLELYQE